MSDISIQTVRDLGMITLRGDIALLAKAAGMNAPAQRMSVAEDGRRLAWMSPDELLLTCPHGEVAARIRDLTAALSGQFATVADVSDARQVFDVKGQGVEEMLAHLMPVDFARMAEGEVRRTRMAQIPAALWREENGWRVVCFRSVAVYAGALLRDAADTAALTGA